MIRATSPSSIALYRAIPFQKFEKRTHTKVVFLWWNMKCYLLLRCFSCFYHNFRFWGRFGAETENFPKRLFKRCILTIPHLYNLSAHFSPTGKEEWMNELYFLIKVNLTIKIKRKWIFRFLSFQQSSSHWQQSKNYFIPISMEEIYCFVVWK